MAFFCIHHAVDDATLRIRQYYCTPSVQQAKWGEFIESSSFPRSNLPLKLHFFTIAIRNLPAVQVDVLRLEVANRYPFPSRLDAFRIWQGGNYEHLTGQSSSSSFSAYQLHHYLVLG